MKTLLYYFNFFYFTLFVLAFSENSNAQCTIASTTNASSLTCGSGSINACNGILYIGDGTTSMSLIMNAALDLSCLGPIQLMIRNNAAIDFSSGNDYLTLANGSSLALEGSGTLIGGSCNASERIYIGGNLLASCNGNPNADYSFPTLIAAGGYSPISVAASPSSICNSGTSTITATANPSSGATYKWYTVSSGGSAIFTGNPYSTGTISTSTTYYVQANYSTYSTVRKAVTVTINPLPTAYSVTGGGSYCSGGTGVAIGLANSAVGVNYQLQLAGVNTGTAVAGTGSAISFGLKTTAGTYTVIATNATTTCTSGMTGSAVITINPLPTAYAVTGGGSYCSGGTGVTIGLANSNVGVNYQLQLGGVNTGTAVAGTGSAISFGLKTTAGTYTVIATNATTTCTSGMTGSAIITINPLPTITSVSAPATICKGSSATINLASITGTGSSYNLYTASSGGTLIGTIPQTVAPTTSTTYYVEAVSSAGCISSTRKAVTVTVYSLVDNTGSGFSSSSFCPGNQATITFDANNGSGVLPYTVSYRNDTTLAISSQTIVTDSPTTINLSPNPTSTTHYTLLSITDANGCVNSSPSDATATATILALPSAPTPATPTQPTCALATGSVVLSGLPASGTINQTGFATASYSITGTTMTLSGLAIGTYNFTATNASGCTSLASANVTINPLITNTYTTSWDNGTPNGDQNIVFDGAFSSTGDVTACSCLVKAGKIVTINPLHTLTITNAVTVEPTGILKFKSDLNPPLSNSASLVQINNVSNSGTIIYERLTNTVIRNTDYTYWSSPVSAFTLGDVSPNTLAGKFYSFDDVTQDWKQESSATTMLAGLGYLIRGPEASIPPVPPSQYLATFEGVPNNGLYTLSNVTADNLYLLGNPYPSAINADTFLNENSGVLDGTLYFWTHNTKIDLASSTSNPGSGLYAYSSDDYASYNLTGGVGTASSALSDPSYPSGKIPDGKIPAGQGFFGSSIVSPSGNTIVYNNTIRVAGSSGNNSQFFKTSSTKAKTANAVEKDRIWLDLTNTQGAFKQTLVGYVTDATNGYENRFDGESFDGNDFIDFYSVLQDKNLTIQGRALPFDEKDTVQLGYKSTIKGNFAISIDQTDGLLTNQSVYLEDKLTNTVFDLKSGNYTFNTTAGTFNDRFILRYKNNAKTLNTANFIAVDKTVVVSNKNSEIKVNSYIGTIDKVIIFDLLGKEIFQKNDVNSDELLITNILSNHQVLVVKTTLQNGTKVTDKIIY